MDKPKQTWSYSGKHSDELNDDDKNEKDYRIMMINAQTGEVFDRYGNRGGGDACYQGFIPWDKVK